MIEYDIIILTFVLSFLFDIIFGELPSLIHPVVIIGSLIDLFKKYAIKIKNKMSGVIVVAGVCSVSCIILYLIYLISYFNMLIYIVVFIIILSSTFSFKMLVKTASDVKKALDEDIEKARSLISYLVSRDTTELSESLIVSAAVESLSENITDSYVAPVFYYFISAGIVILLNVNCGLFYILLVPVLYRVFNTLDAMLGYQTDELINIGYVPAKIDDILNYIPARISGIFIVISSFILRYNGSNAFRIMMRDARNCPSPNSGYTMATTAGALDIQLVKKDTYILGDNTRVITADDISKSVRLTEMTIILFTVTVIVLFILFLRLI